MLRLLIIILISVLLLPGGSLASFDGMRLQGQGESHYLGFIKVYDAALYTLDPVASDQILSANISRCLALTYAVALTSEEFARGADAILARQHSQAKLAGVKTEIHQLHGAYRDVKKGDTYSLCYDSDSGITRLALNKKNLISIPSVEFAEIYFGIWLGPKAPIDEKLREKLLTHPDTK